MDQYLTHYSDLDDASIPFSVFTRISFTCGVPAIMLDFICYLTGAHECEKSRSLATKAFAMLYDRVPPIIFREPTSSALPAANDGKSPYKLKGNLLNAVDL